MLQAAVKLFNPELFLAETWEAGMTDDTVLRKDKAAAAVNEFIEGLGPEVGWALEDVDAADIVADPNQLYLIQMGAWGAGLGRRALAAGGGYRHCEGECGYAGEAAAASGCQLCTHCCVLSTAPACHASLCAAVNPAIEACFEYKASMPDENGMFQGEIGQYNSKPRK